MSLISYIGYGNLEELPGCIVNRRAFPVPNKARILEQALSDAYDTVAEILGGFDAKLTLIRRRGK